MFYRSMLDGETFGRALKTARDRHATSKFPDSNTWGAYQAYGDPDYRLDPDGYRRHGSRRWDMWTLPSSSRRCATSGAAAEARHGRRQSLDPAVKKLDALGERLPHRLARANRRADGDRLRLRQARAVRSRRPIPRRPRSPVRATTSTTTLRAVEQLANFEARLADDITDGQAERARELHESAIARLEKLLAVAETAERYSLLGSAYKRRAAAEPNARTAKRRRCLGRPKTTGRRIELKPAAPGPRSIPRVELADLATLLDEQVPDADALIERCEATARERFSIDRKFLHGDRDRRRWPWCARSDRAGSGRTARRGTTRSSSSKTVFQEIVE